MYKLKFFIRYALHGLMRGGQRIIVALLAVTFGVMSLVAMTLMAHPIAQAMQIEDALMLGGDLSIWSGTPREPGDFGDLEALQQAGIISAYAPQDVLSYQVMIRDAQTQRASQIYQAIAVSPETYPLKGTLTFLEPEDTPLQQVLQAPQSVVVTQDIAKAYNLKIGDPLTIFSPEGSAVPVRLHVTGIVSSNPTQMGQTIYYSLDTARALYPTVAFITNIKINTPQPTETQALLEQQGWDVYIPADASTNDSASIRLFVLMLKGAGILGLIVGGIGIANTMQVLLSQRLREIAVLKTMGYSQRDMIIIFSLEAAVLGVVGAAVGAALGIFLSKLLVNLFGNISTVLLTWQIHWPLVISAVLVGVMSTVIFALQAIVRHSSVRPAAILRQQITLEGRLQWLRSFGFYMLLALPFTLTISLIVGSIGDSIIILIASVAGLIALSLVLGAALWIGLRIIPAFRFRLLGMARNQMRRRGISLIFAVIALFIGIYTLGFALAIIQISLDEMALRTDTTVQHNLKVLVPAEDAEQAQQILIDEGLTDIESWTLYNVASASITTPDDSTHDLAINQIMAREHLWDYTVTDGPTYESQTESAYLSSYVQYPVSSSITIVTYATEQTNVILAGYVENAAQSALTVAPYQALLVTPDIIAALPEAQIQHVFFATATPGQSNTIAQHIGEKLTTSIISTQEDFTEVINSSFNNLFLIALVMSGLAVLAGLMLIANAVSLALIRRRYEIGVMKSVGYTRRHILTTLALEYSLIAFIASAAGLIAVQVTLFALGASQGPQVMALLVMRPMTAIIILLGGIALTIGTVILAAWKPTQVPPVAILNEA